MRTLLPPELFVVEILSEMQKLQTTPGYDIEEGLTRRIAIRDYQVKRELIAQLADARKFMVVPGGLKL